MNEIIKGMANAAEAIQENFEEQGERLETVEQKVVAGTHTHRTTAAQSYVEFLVNYPEGFDAQNMTVTVSPVTLVGSGLILYQVTAHATQVRLRLRTFDSSTIPVGTDITIQYQFVRIDN